MPAALRTINARNEEEARSLLERSPEHLPAVVSSLLIGVTHFFRDGPVFNALRKRVLPELAKLGRPPRVWSAGCADGAELYSVAILLSEAGLLPAEASNQYPVASSRGRKEDASSSPATGSRLPATGCLLGTDLRPDAVEQARAGVFDPADVEAIEPGLRQEYFQPHGQKWQVSPSLRRWTSWRTSNVLMERPAGSWDVILCRNVFIYLAPDASADLWRRLHDALAPGGFLMVGKAERPARELPLSAVHSSLYRREETI